MATKIKLILQKVPRNAVLFSSWLSKNGIDRKEQTSYVRSGWIERISHVCQVFLIVRFWRDRGWIGDDDDRWEPGAFILSREGIHGMPAPFPG